MRYKEGFFYHNTRRVKSVKSVFRLVNLVTQFNLTAPKLAETANTAEPNRIVNLLAWLRRRGQSRKPPRGSLVIQPLPGIGDMVWHLPHIHALAKLEGPITVLTKARSQAAELVRADPSVGTLKILHRPGRHAGLIGAFRLSLELRRDRYASAWLLHGSTRYAWVLVLAGIPKRSGYGRGWQRYLLNSTQLPPENLADHPIAKANLLLTRAGISIPQEIPVLKVDPYLQQQIDHEYGSADKPWIALGIGSSERFKQWGDKNFSVVACELRKRYQASIFLLGGPSEQPMAEAIIAQVFRHIAYKPVYRRQSIAEAAAILAGCRLFIGNDTGTLNMAAALGVPCIGLFGATPALTHMPSIIALGPLDNQKGMDAIMPAHVLTKINEIM